MSFPLWATSGPCLPSKSHFKMTICDNYLLLRYQHCTNIFIVYHATQHSLTAGVQKEGTKRIDKYCLIWHNAVLYKQAETQKDFCSCCCCCFSILKHPVPLLWWFAVLWSGILQIFNGGAEMVLVQFSHTPPQAGYNEIIGWIWPWISHVPYSNKWCPISRMKFRLRILMILRIEK